MLKELRDILDSRIPDTDKLKAVTSLVESCYTQQEYKDLLYSSMGTPKSFGKIIEGLPVDALWHLIESSELDPSDSPPRWAYSDGSMSSSTSSMPTATT